MKVPYENYININIFFPLDSIFAPRDGIDLNSDMDAADRSATQNVIQPDIWPDNSSFFFGNRPDIYQICNRLRISIMVPVRYPVSKKAGSAAWSFKWENAKKTTDFLGI